MAHVMLLSVVTAFVAAARGHGGLALAGLAVWAGCSLFFFLKRLQGTSHRLSDVIEMAVTSLFIPPLSLFWRIYGGFKYNVVFI